MEYSSVSDKNSKRLAENVAKQAQRTPGPWFVADSIGLPRIECSTHTIATAAPVHGMRPVLGVEQANAAFIVRACNSHDDLLAALIECERIMGTHPAFKISTARMNARAAIAKAEA